GQRGHEPQLTVRRRECLTVAAPVDSLGSQLFEPFRTDDYVKSTVACHDWGTYHTLIITVSEIEGACTRSRWPMKAWAEPSPAPNAAPRWRSFLKPSWISRARTMVKSTMRDAHAQIHLPRVPARGRGGR